MPFFLYLFPEAIPSDPSDEKHPLIIAFSVSLRNSSYFYIIIGFLSIGLFGPILEEFIFRGLLLEETHDQNRKKWVRYLLDALVCLFFAVLHIPVSFFIPLVAAIAFIYVRRRSKSLLPSIFMHIAWNTNLLIIHLISGGYWEFKPTNHWSIDGKRLSRFPRLDSMLQMLINDTVGF